MSGRESLAGQLAQRGVSVALEIIHADTFHGHCMHDARDAVKVASEDSLRRFFPNLPDRWLELSGAPVFGDAYCVYRPHELEGTVVDFLRTIGQSHPAR